MNSSLFPILLAAYLIGNISSGYWLVRLTGRGDVRKQGSGATGATNAARVLGKKGFFAVLTLDMLKGALGISLPALAEKTGLLQQLPWLATQVREPGSVFAAHTACGLAVVAGHIWPICLGFRGGKGIAPFLGIWVALGAVSWPDYWFVPLTLLAPIVAGLFFLPLKKGAFMSALCGLVAQPSVLWLTTGNEQAVALAFAATACVLFAHRSNFENAFSKS
ncbi:MAG: glycerol-3-phosphate acyltransferase [Puniceicoccales bacterium]|jgi:glycerol-3-phosphate acyltransferase PlsY|nr:glycerol-3-phosphate acyltransferase [Puniceicoccales bacterium]